MDGEVFGYFHRSNPHPPPNPRPPAGELSPHRFPIFRNALGRSLAPSLATARTYVRVRLVALASYPRWGERLSPIATGKRPRTIREGIFPLAIRDAFVCARYARLA